LRALGRFQRRRRLLRRRSGLFLLLARGVIVVAIVVVVVGENRFELFEAVTRRIRVRRVVVRL